MRQIIVHQSYENCETIKLIGDASVQKKEEEKKWDKIINTVISVN